MSTVTARVVLKPDYLDKLKQELLDSCKDQLFEVHHGPPPFWNEQLDSKLTEYLSVFPTENYSTCPVCSHKLTGAKCSSNFYDPWWMYPQRSFNDVEICSHFEGLTFSILWNQSEPISAPWLIPCGWGVPALTEELSHNDNLAVTIKTQSLSNGAIIFWMGFYRKYPGISLFNNFWSIPSLKLRSPPKPSPQTRGYWNTYQPLSTHSPIVWSKLYLEQNSGEHKSYENDRDADYWLNKIQNWQALAYTQPMKMYFNKMVTESGVASFALGMRASKTKGALFISQTPLFNPIRSTSTPLHHYSTPASLGPSTENPALSALLNSSLNASTPQSSPITAAPILPILQTLTRTQLEAIAETNTLWAVIDPFQNESTQEWIRLIKNLDASSLRLLWQDSNLKQNWQLAADYSQPDSLKADNTELHYRDQSPVLVQISPEALELSYRFNLENQAWGAFFISEYFIDELHCQLRDILFSNLQNQWIYFRFYDANFLTFALSTLQGKNLNYFFKNISAWIICNKHNGKYSMFTTSSQRAHYSIEECSFPKSFPTRIYEAAQKSYQLDLPRRIREFIKEKAPEFADLIPEPILDRWIRESIRQSYQWGIRKEVHITKFFLWKIFITPTWCNIGPFIRILQQKNAEEIKIQHIENLLPQLKLAELPRSLSIESWDSELWNELRKVNSPLVNTDPQAFHPLLGEQPPLMPLNNPKWLRILGEFYDAAYADIYSQTGLSMINISLLPNLQRPTHAPPRIHSVLSNELVIREDGFRSHEWLQRSGFERLNNSKDFWSLKSNSVEQIAYVARRFLEEFPYLESKYALKTLGNDLEHTITYGLNLFTITYDEHHFWYLDDYTFSL